MDDVSNAGAGVGSDSVDFSISGYSQDDVIVTQQLGRITVSFKGSNDSVASILAAMDR